MERVVFACREVHVYRVPQSQLVQARFLCQEWEGEHLFTGRCRVVEEEEGQVWIRLEDRLSGELFAESSLDESGRPRHVVDSCRYFVLQVKDRMTQRKAFLGIGFEQRGEAFDFLASLDDAKRQKMDEQIEPPAPKDFSLKQGQKLRLSLPNMKKTTSTEEAPTVEVSQRTTLHNNDGDDWLFQDTRSDFDFPCTTPQDNTFVSKKSQSQPSLDELLF